MSNDCYLYIFLDTRKPGKYCYSSLNISFLYEPFYIGIGKYASIRRRPSRMKHHINAMKRGVNNYTCNKIKKIIQETNKEPIYFKLFDNLEVDEAKQAEISIIKTIGRIDLKTGPLTNLTDGGDGGFNRIVTDQTRQIWSKQRRGRKLKQSTKDLLSIALKGRHHSKEVIERVSKKNKGQRRTDEQKQRMSDAHLGIRNFGHKVSDKCKNKISKYFKGKAWSENRIRATKFVYTIRNKITNILYESIYSISAFCKNNNVTRWYLFKSNEWEIIKKQNENHKI